MITEEGLRSIFTSYRIEHVILVKEESSLNFVISNMKSNISLNNWENLENILKDIYKKEINIITKEQCLKYLGKNFISKGETIL